MVSETFITGDNALGGPRVPRGVFEAIDDAFRGRQDGVWWFGMMFSAFKEPWTARLPWDRWMKVLLRRKEIQRFLDFLVNEE